MDTNKELITCTKEELSNLVQKTVTEALASIPKKEETKTIVDEYYCKEITDECDIEKKEPTDDEGKEINNREYTPGTGYVMSTRQAFESNSGDVRIILKNKKVLHVHKLILLTYSSKKFDLDVKEIDLTNYDPTVVYFLFRYMYYDRKFNANKYSCEQWFELLKLAHEYSTNLINDIVIQVKNVFDPSNIFDIYNLAIKYNNKEIEMVALEYITNKIIKKIGKHICYDDIVPGTGIRPREHNKHLCCKHLGHTNNTLKMPDMYYEDENREYYCIAYTMENKVPNKSANSTYCCQHKDICTKHKDLDLSKEYEEFMIQFKKLPIERQTQILLKTIY